MSTVDPDDVPLTATAPAQANNEPIPATQVEPQRAYRSFPPALRLQLLAEYDALPRSEKGAFLRKHGLYTAHLSDWRFAASRSPVPGPDPRDARIAQLQLDLAAQSLRAQKAEALLDLQKKVMALVESLQTNDSKPK